MGEYSINYDDADILPYVAYHVQPAVQILCLVLQVFLLQLSRHLT